MNLEKLWQERLKALEGESDKDMASPDLTQRATEEAENMVRLISAEQDAKTLKEFRRLSAFQPVGSFGVVNERAPSCGEKCTFGCSGGCGLVCAFTAGSGTAVAALGGTFGGSGAGIATTSVLVASTGPQP